MALRSRADGTKFLVCQKQYALKRTRRIRAQIAPCQAEDGNLGKHRSVGGGVIELKIHFGPGYRLYLGQEGENLIILLCGGDKGTQGKDIRRAQYYWRDYRSRT